MEDTTSPLANLLIELDPPHGITGFPLGMPAASVKEAAAALYDIRVSHEGRATSPLIFTKIENKSIDWFHHMQILAIDPQFEIMFHLEDGKALTAVEVWIPQPGDREIKVLFHGLDVFRTPALQLLDHIRTLGYTVLPDPFHPIVPKLSLGFTRVESHEVPLDPTDGEPLYFQSVLVGPTNYYDSTLKVE